MKNDIRAVGAQLVLRAALRSEGGPFSQRELADLIGVSQGLVSKMVNGDAPISTETLDRLAAFYGMKPQAFASRLGKWAREPERAREHLQAQARRRAESETPSLGLGAPGSSRGRRGPSLSSLPPFEVRTVDAADVATDVYGQLWVDPRAAVGPADVEGDERGGMRFLVERFNDGTVRLDKGQVEEQLDGIGIRDERHSLLVTDERDVPRRALRPIYLSTVLELLNEGRPVRRYTARPWASRDELGDTRPLKKDFVSGLPDGVERLTVITAESPWGRRVPDEQQARLDDQLRAQLKSMVGKGRMFDVLAKAPEGADEWTERSFGVAGLGLDAARELGRQFGQLAFFVITSDEFQLHWVDDAA